VTERTARDSAQLRERAIELRRAGKSVRQIKQILGPVGKRTLHDALRGEPPPEWTRRPNAKDDLRARARELRRQGLDYEEIVAQLGVSKSSVSLWVRDLPRPLRVTPEECAKRASERMRRHWAAERPVRAARRAAANVAAAAAVGDLTEREILIAGSIAYRCEGARNKPHRRVDRVTFANSDPALISFFLLFLDTAGVPRPDLAFQLQIHETADVDGAIRFWLTVTGARPDQFRKVSLKQGNPLTTRKNTGDGYHGCLRVDVMRSCELYRKIEGWASAVTAAAESPGCSGTVGLLVRQKLVPN
jgi:transcriptional regulator with XRE-family HTH domain